MLETAMKLSDSRLLLFGAIAVDTVGMGTLALLLTTPQITSSSTLLLISLAVTAPVLALTVGASALLVPKRLDPEERARRAILAGAILHMAIQANALLPMLCACGRGPTHLRLYVLQTTVTAAIAFMLLGAIAVLTAAWRRFSRNVPALPSDRTPDSEL